jgi:hypothetical protein
MNLNNLNIGCFTFNLGLLNTNYNEFNTTQKQNFSENILNDFKDNMNINKNIWIISTQEDNDSTIFCRLIKKYFEEYDYDLLQYKKVGKSILGNGNFFLHLLIFVKKDIKHYIKCKSTKIITHLTGIKYYLKTKNSIIINIQLLNNINKYTNLFVIGSHLPINTKDQITYGYDTRIKIINDVLHYLENYMKKEKFNSTSNNNGNHIIWLGDLNFRFEKYNDITSNQIYKYINESKSNNNNSIKLKDLSNIKKFGPTCKVIVGPIKLTKKCMEQYNGKSVSNKDCYDTTKRKVLHPSYCDRILGWSDGNLQLKSTIVKPLSNTFMTTFSDHNPIIGELKFIKNSKK